MVIVNVIHVLLVINIKLGWVVKGRKVGRGRETGEKGKRGMGKRRNRTISTVDSRNYSSLSHRYPIVVHSLHKGHVYPTMEVGS